MAEKKKDKKKAKKSKISFQELTVEELEKMKVDIKKELQEIRFKIVTGSVSNVKKISHLKKDYARAMTFLKLKKNKPVEVTA